MGHTPTPWHVVDDYHTTRSCIEIQDGSHRSVATIYNGPGDEFEKDAEGVTRNDHVRVANAAFIVTACNAHEQLVAALKKMTNHADFYCDSGPPGEGWQSDELVADIADARAALAAAGQS